VIISEWGASKKEEKGRGVSCMTKGGMGAEGLQRNREWGRVGPVSNELDRGNQKAGRLRRGGTKGELLWKGITTRQE